jgi:hypothetical protein
MKAAEVRGAIRFCDFILTGKLDEEAKAMLGLREETPKPAPGYMRQEIKHG